MVCLAESYSMSMMLFMFQKPVTIHFLTKGVMWNFFGTSCFYCFDYLFNSHDSVRFHINNHTVWHLRYTILPQSTYLLDFTPSYYALFSTMKKPSCGQKFYKILKTSNCCLPVLPTCNLFLHPKKHAKVCQNLIQIKNTFPTQGKGIL